MIIILTKTRKLPWWVGWVIIAAMIVLGEILNRFM